MVEQTLTPRGLLHAVIAEVARERDLDPLLIEGRCRLRKVTRARAVIAKRLAGRGVSEQQIARMMKTSLQTVQIYLGRRAPDRRTARAKEDVLS